MLEFMQNEIIGGLTTAPRTIPHDKEGCLSDHVWSSGIYVFKKRS